MVNEIPFRGVITYKITESRGFRSLHLLSHAFPILVGLECPKTIKFSRAFASLSPCGKPSSTIPNREKTNIFYEGTVVYVCKPPTLSPPAHIFFCHHRTLHACRMTPLTQPEAAPSSRGGRIYSILRKPASNLALRISDLDRYRLNMWEVSWAAPKESRKEHRENKATATPKGNATPKARSLFSRGSSSSSEVPPFCKRRNVETISPTVSVSSSAKTSATSYHDESDSISTFSISSEQTTVHVPKIVNLRNRRNGQLIDTTRPSTGMHIARGVANANDGRSLCPR